MISATRVDGSPTDRLFEDWLGPETAGAPEPDRVPVELTPLQRWYLETVSGDPGLWTASLFVEARERLDPERLRRALRSVMAHHPALRLQPRRGPGGAWTAEVVADRQPSLHAVDLRPVPAGDRAATVARVAGEAHRALDLDGGRLLHAVLFDGAETSDVLLVIHHLAVDEYSWGILVEHLEAAYADPLAYEAGHEEAEDREYTRWSGAHLERLRSAAGREAAGFWVRQEPAPPLPADFPDGRNLESLAEYDWTELTVDETAALLSRLSREPRLDLLSVLVAALYHTISGWTGERRMGLWIVNHGRTSVLSSTRTSGLVGCVIHSYPVTLETPDPDAGPLEQAVELRRQLAVPAAGLDFGVFRYLDDGPIRERLAALTLPDVILNFGGSFETELTGQLFRAVDLDLSVQGRDPASGRGLLFDVDALVQDGAFRASWKYGREMHRAETVRGLRDDLRRALLELAGALGG